MPGIKRRVQCHFCPASFWASRSDAVRCKKCHALRRGSCQAREEYRKRRAEQYRALREKLFEGYGGKCACCGESRYEFLALDHIKGGGRKERRKLSTQQIALRAVREGFPKQYRILCHNCNQAIGWYGYCPHQEAKWKRTA